MLNYHKLLCFLVGHLRILQIELQLHFLTPRGDLNQVEFLIMDVEYAKSGIKLGRTNMTLSTYSG